MRLQLCPESIPQRALELALPFRVVPNQAFVFLYQPVISKPHPERDVALDEVVPYCQEQISERYATQSLQPVFLVAGGWGSLV